MKELMDIAVDEAMGEEAEYAMLPKPTTGKTKREEADPDLDAAGPSEHRDKKKKKKIKQGQLVAAAEPKQVRPQGRAPQQRRPMDGPPSDHFEKMLDGPCPKHAGPVKHRYRDCALLKKFFQGRLEGVPAPAPAGNPNLSFPDDVECLMIFGGPEAHASKRQVKLFERKVYAVTPAVPEFLRWSDTAITFDRNDHPDYVPQPGKLPLVVSPIVSTKRLTRVLMDGGSGLNILYASTLDKMVLTVYFGAPSMFITLWFGFDY
jgi:hypothetical protein